MRSVTVNISQRRDSPRGLTYSTVGCVKSELITSGQPSPVKSYANCTPLKYLVLASIVAAM